MECRILNKRENEFMNSDKYQKLLTFHFAPEIQKRHAKKSLKCIIFGNFGAMNLGDEAILAGEIQELQKIPGMSITVIGRYPEEVKRQHKVNAISLYQLNKVRREIRKSDFVIVGGGGLINKVERSLIGFVYQLYMIFVFFFLPWLHKKKTYVLGIGIYNNANAFIVRLVTPFLRNSTIVTVRDFHSYEFLKSKNVRGMLYKDNSFLMDLLPASETLQSPIFKENYHKNRRNIGISLLKPDNKSDEKRLLSEMTEFVGKHYKEADFWYYPADANPDYFNDEMFGRKFYELVSKKFGQEVVFHFVPNTLSPNIFFSSFALMNSVVAMRFHAAVFAYRNKIKFAGITYDKKCTTFIESIGKKPLFLKSLQVEDIDKEILTP
jgi:polysaccharide pyruvyl transferase WcaK-like protein